MNKHDKLFPNSSNIDRQRNLRLTPIHRTDSVSNTHNAYLQGSLSP